MRRSSAYKFWEGWYRADSLQRAKMLEKTTLVRMMMEGKKGLRKETKARLRKTYALVVNTFFEDLLDYLAESGWAVFYHSSLE